MKKVIIGLCVLLTAALAGMSVFYVNSNKAKTEQQETAVTSEKAEDSADYSVDVTEVIEPDQNDLAGQTEDVGAVVEYNGKKYKYNYNLQNFLLIGVDIWEPFADSYDSGEAGQADAILLVSLNRETHEAKLFAIHRNTMVNVKHYDNEGHLVDTVNQQICLQYAYTSGNANGCLAMKETVSDLLYNLDIDGYVAISGGGISSLTDSLGGVDVRITGDYTDVDALFTDGSVLHMDGETALKFVHYRDTYEYDSATDRMNRQLDFMVGILNNMSTQSTSGLYKIFEKYADEYILTDLSADQVMSLVDYTYDVNDILSVPGTMKAGLPYEEYVVDETALQELILEYFYVEQ